MIGNICSIQPFSVHDGPGIRTTVFMKGCSLRCFWCHNPESQESAKTVAYYPHKCIGCGACGTVCPYAKNGRAAFHTENCIRCGACAKECFAQAIETIGEEISADRLTERILKDKSVLCSSGGGVTYSLLPFHNMCRSKYISQGRIFEASDIEEPSAENMARLTALLQN